MLLVPAHFDSQMDFITSMLSTGTHVIIKAEYAISIISGAALLAIIIPISILVTLDLLAFGVSMGAESFAKYLFRDAPEANTSSTIPALGVVFSTKSSRRIKDIFLGLQSMRPMPPNLGLWLMKDEEHS